MSQQRKRTSINVSQEIKEPLDNLGRRHESYSDIVGRLLDAFEDSSESEVQRSKTSKK
jgi:predicted DNA-binding protein